MSAPAIPPFVSPLLPNELLHILKDSAPHGSLSVSAIDAETCLNGEEMKIASQWLSETEYSQLNRFSFDKRRSEWLSGRICAKQAVLDYLGRGKSDLDPRKVRIEANPSGRPFLNISGLPATARDVDISISHSHGKAVAIAGNGLCGVDIQYLSETLFKVKDRYCTDIETALLDVTSIEELAQLGLLWVAKEAVRKSLSGIALTGFLEIHLEGLRMEQNYHILNFKLEKPFSSLGTVSVTTNLNESFALAVSTIARERVNA